jgi:preprotein translocase subunit SecE
MTKDDLFWVNVGYVVFAMIVGYVGFRAFDTLGVQFGWSERFDWYPLFSNVGAIAIGCGGAYWMRSDAGRLEYHIATINETRKVSWPSGPDTKRMTIIVVIVVAVFSFILAIFDTVWAYALKKIIE